MGSRMGGVMVGLLLVACEAPDGGTCSSDEDCASNRCEHDVCQGSDCTESSTVCEPGWACLDQGIDWIFGIHHYRCVMECVDGICPTEHTCGRDCSDVVRSLTIVSTPGVPRAREPFQLTAVLNPEPSGTTFQWTSQSDGTVTALSKGRTIELSLEAGIHTFGVTADVHMDFDDNVTELISLGVCPLAGESCNQEHHVACCAPFSCDQLTHVCD